MPLTVSQEEAILARNRELLVSAAAGSGKTRVLIERIFSLLKDDGLSLDRMLIVTFTHAAAAEMRERLQARLADAATEDQHMRRQAEHLETAQISTLHSFCQKLVREYFQEVDIDPQAILGDETGCANLLVQAQEEAMNWLYEQAKNDSDLAALAAKFEDQKIVDMLNDLYPFLMAKPTPFAWLDQCAHAIYTENDLRCGDIADTLLSDCRMLLSGATELADRNMALSEKPMFRDEYRVTVQSDRIAVDGLMASAEEGLMAMIPQARGFSLSRLPTVRKLEGEEATLRDQYKENRDRIRKLVASVADHLPEEPSIAIAHLNAMQPALRGLSRLIREMDERYALRKRERGLLDFHDLERMTLKILDKPAIREEVSSRYDGVFVDEYQDISGVQEAILNALKRDVSRETSDGTQRYFYVGDVKQSIYRFRQADPTLFMEKERVFSPEATAQRRRITLNANFRSRETVLASVNRVFEHVMRADVTEIEYDGEARLYPGAPSREDPPTSLHLLTQQVRATDRAKLQAYVIGNEIRRRVGEPMTDREGKAAGTLRYRDIAILGPKMKEVSAVLERTLSEMGIPVYCEDRGPAMESEEISQALNHLKLMDNLADDLALITCLRSPAVGMDERELAAVRLHTPVGSFLEATRAAARENDLLGRRCAAALETLRRERFLLSETSLDEYLWGWLGRSGMYAFYGCQPNGKLRQANLRMLCEKAGEHVKRRGGELRDFLDSVKALAGTRSGDSPTVLSPWEDVVRVMTIHKSKGLEFPVVFVMGLEEPFNQRRGSRLSLHPRLGVALPYVNQEARTTGETLLGSAVNLRAQAEERAERARLLYVAMTRAREELILVGCGNQLTPENAAVGFPQCGNRSAYAVSSAGSMLAWVCQCVQPTDSVEVCGEGDVSDNGMRTIAPETVFSTQHTSIPQKTAGWRLVFHNDTEELKAAQRYAQGKKERTEPERRKTRLQALTEQARLVSEGLLQRESATPADGSRVNPVAALMFENAVDHASGTTEHNDPVAPALHFSHHPFKVGATALARAQNIQPKDSAELYDPAEGDPSEAESVDRKRLPLPLTRPKRMDDQPLMPSFLRALPEQTGLRRGVATHRALSLLDYGGLREALPSPVTLRAEVERQLDGLRARRCLTEEERRLVDAETVARFFESPCGRNALGAETVHREWSFNLRLPERDGLIVQGVIDLCYLSGGQWSLVDYKTDRVSEPEELWKLYGTQIALYRRALVEATGFPVREATLFSLSLGLGSNREQEGPAVSEGREGLPKTGEPRRRIDECAT